MDELLDNFRHNVVLKYSLYNSLFLTLPFQQMQEVGTLLSLFGKYCSVQIRKGKSPQEIVNQFFKKKDDKINILFTMLHFVERQVVLFDALEDAAFNSTHDLSGSGSFANLSHKISGKKQKDFAACIMDYRVKLALTAHPTQFYPPPILGIINQLTAAIKADHLKKISDLLWQMGKTSFKYQQKPTPFQEALSLTWFVENIFYQVIPDIHQQIKKLLSTCDLSKHLTHPVVQLGFWPGGDRDGNPYISADVTLAVAKLLKTKILKLYHRDLRLLSRRLTFKGIIEPLSKIKRKIEETYLAAELGQIKKTEIYQTAEQFLDDLQQLKKILIEEHQGLFLDHLDKMITKVTCFKFYFASIDMRENAPNHRQVFDIMLKCLSKKHKELKISHEDLVRYSQSSHENKWKILEKIFKSKLKIDFKDDIGDSVFQYNISAMAVIKEVQASNGEQGLCRYIISNTQRALDVMELLVMLRLAGKFSGTIPVDIVPLFENIEDLENADKIMEELYLNPLYRDHLQKRNHTQVIMLGFSDGTKDGGYVSANWSIYKAKVNLTQVSQRYQVKVVFFDGRGGPPARGGGNTHNFYRSLGSKIRHQDLQLTIQGQTISANFGTQQSAKYNLEQLFTAGIDDLIFPHHANDLDKSDANLLEELSKRSRDVYQALKENDLFIPYLEQMTPLKFYGELNIGSRPTSRKKNGAMQFSDLRAIPFVGSWSQLKQNIPGYYGFGSALDSLIKSGKESQLIKLYHDSLFFRTLVENTMMSLSKTFFPLTAYMKQDKKFGKFWQMLQHEAKLTEKHLLKISNQKQLLEKDPLIRESIKLREAIVLPLLIIQQYAMTEIKTLTEDSPLYKTYKQMILKALAANTNASRNSA